MFEGSALSIEAASLLGMGTALPNAEFCREW